MPAGAGWPRGRGVIPCVWKLHRDRKQMNGGQGCGEGDRGWWLTGSGTLCQGDQSVLELGGGRCFPSPVNVLNAAGCA